MAAIQPEIETLDQQSLKHLREMSFASVNEYRQWCFEHGFSRGLHKHASLRAEELQVRQAKFHANQKQRQREARQPLVVLLAACRGELSSEEIQQASIKFCAQRIESAARSETDPLNRSLFMQFVEQLIAVRAKFVLAATEPINMLGHESSWIDGLINVCMVHGSWMRPIVQWRPRGHNARRQFSGLLRHLFAKYDDVPNFMDTAWLASDPSSQNHRQWFVHLGRGQNLRHCQLPLMYTKRMAHYFMQAPDNLSISQALRYGNVLGLGGDARLARAILGTRLGSEFQHQEFWESVLRWIIGHPMLDRAQIGPIVDYIHYHKFAADELVVAPAAGVSTGDVQRQLNFSMRGRTPETLMRQVHRWHAKLSTDNRIQLREWSPIGIKPLEFVEGQDPSQPHAPDVRLRKSFKFWSIRELLSTQALIAEGRELRHCVATYAHSCAQHRSSIWTMRLATEAGVTKLLTIEIHPQTRTIVQVRGKFNRLAQEMELKILQRWATQENLRIGAIT